MLRSRRSLRALAAWFLALAALAALAAGCGAQGPIMRAQQVSDGDPEAGRQALADYGCVSCHKIPGVRGGNGVVAPPLDRFGLRAYIAGSLTNDQDNLVLWIMEPQEVEPGTAMPNLGVTEPDAVNMSAYLLSLD